jgi:alpha-glucosidase
MLLGLRNTPFIYYGEEIGMEDVDVPAELQQDPARIHTMGRDPERTPMQWDGSPGRGFTTGEPWLPFGSAACNVAAQQDDPDSLLSLYRRAIWLRKRTPALLRGGYRELPAPEGVFAWVRELPGAPAVTVAVNTATVAHELPVARGKVILATHRDLEGTPAGPSLSLPPVGAAMVEAAAP